MSKGFMIIATILIIALLAVCPFISIWALNTLFVGVVFTAEIPITMWTYLSMLWCGGIIGAFAKSAIA